MSIKVLEIKITKDVYTNQYIDSLKLTQSYFCKYDSCTPFEVLDLFAKLGLIHNTIKWRTDFL